MFVFSKKFRRLYDYLKASANIQMNFLATSQIGFKLFNNPNSFSSATNMLCNKLFSFKLPIPQQLICYATSYFRLNYRKYDVICNPRVVPSKFLSHSFRIFGNQNAGAPLTIKSIAKNRVGYDRFLQQL